MADKQSSNDDRQAPSDQKFGVAAPQLSLPKGGGAIRSIGEKFAANPVTGTGSMSVPIATSPGRSGFGPRLSLSYDSGAGNGPFGFGWSLSLQTISRKTDKGLPSYQDTVESDVFVLSGAEDLVPVRVQDALGKWEREKLPLRSVGGASYRIDRYRPRIEGLFARIERWTNDADARDVFWRTISRDNVTTWYGRTSESRIADPSDWSRIFNWSICQQHDDKGNVIIYDYKPEDSARLFEDGAGNSILKHHERNRTDASRAAQRYLKRIRYGNRSPYFPALKGDAPWPEPPNAEDGSDTWHFEVVLDYGEHDADAPTPDGAGVRKWPARRDPFSSCRAGFEVRTLRVCQRVLMFHHFPVEAGVGRDCLVRSTEFSYSDEVDPTDVRNPVYTFLRSVSQTGYLRSPGGYSKRSLPPVAFDYTEPVVQETVEEVEPGSLANLPEGLDGSAWRWTDLHGEGITGLLTEQAGTWFYKRNESPVPTTLADGRKSTKARFAALEAVTPRPNAALANGAEFMDLAGDGLPDLVMLEGPTPGLFEHDVTEGWEPFRPFTSRLDRSLRDPNLRFIDLDGDGHPDVLVTEDEAFVWHSSLGEAGFGAARRVALALDEEHGPRIVFGDGTQSIHLADLSGDGLTDIARIRNGEACYWPNLGHGRFGAKVTMDNAPWFDESDQFDPARLRIADIDGSGTSDLVYLHRDGVRLYFNQSGNSWSRAHVMGVFPRVDDLVRILPVDLLGNGTACLVWSSSAPADAGRQMRYVNLMGGVKPHLMVRTVNNLGAESRVTYAPSTKFYLEDKRAGKPWVTRLPFPVHVVERMESIDHVARTRFATRYAYHHGYFDGEEREFRGFGMVEQWDTEAFHEPGPGQTSTPGLDQAPVVTRTWYHTGAFADAPRLLQRYRGEFYQHVQHLDGPVMPLGLAPDELRECFRALKGVPLRQEVYGLDGSPQEAHPYTVSENRFEVRRLQPRAGQRHSVFFTVSPESVAFNHERESADPRVAHTFGLELDEYGNPRQSCSVVYGRKAVDGTLPMEVRRDQARLYIICTETDYTPDIDRNGPVEAYRLRAPCETRSYEVTGVVPAAGFFELTEIKSAITSAAPIAYEAMASTGAQKRLLSHDRSLFLDNALNPLPLGQWDSLALTHRSHKLAFTPGVVATQYGGQVSDTDMVAAGFVHFAGDRDWWVPSGTPVYPATPSAHFYLAVGSRDPFGVESRVTFDAYDLLIEKTEIVQAAWNVATAVNDYRVLGPSLLTDYNLNRSAVEYDELGYVVRTAIMGKAGATEGDTLADPTTRMEYELFNWMNNGKPNFVHTFARETHGAANLRWQETYAYSNGGGGVALVKTQAHPGKAFEVAADGTRAEVDADPRWVGNGRTLVNNKGSAVEQYEPYFSTTREYEDDAVLREIGVTPVLRYDPIGRNVRNDYPNGTFSRIEFAAWWQKVFDANDTVLQSRWYTDRGSPDPTSDPEPLNDPERRAAWLAAKHADTPALTHFDSLGRAIYAVSDYGGGKTAAMRSELDLTGRLSKLFDAVQREVSSGFVGMAGMPVSGASAEKGRHWIFQNVLGALVKTWDEHGRRFRNQYDELHRPVGTFVQEAGQPEILFNYIVYGDRLPNAEQLNLMGTAHQVFDQAGMLRVPALDFKGNATAVERVLAIDYRDPLDWQALPAQPSVAGVDAAADPSLETAEVLSAGAQYDALNRPTRVALPDGTVLVPTYDEANLLTRMQARIRGQGAFIDFLKGQDYDAKGQRQIAHYGNEVFTRYFYEPDTFRLARLLTYRSGDDPDTRGLQDLHYCNDPVGNLTAVRDDAQQTHYFNQAVVRPECLYEYDAVYQLVRATGRELAGIGNDNPRTHTDLDFIPPLPHANSASAVRNYVQEYEYDLLGNLSVLKHRFPQPTFGNGWTRRYRYANDDLPAKPGNRLIATSLPGDAPAGPYSATYDHDARGNMTRMPHLAEMAWDSMDQLRRVDLGGGGTAYHVYGAGQQRLRKVIERNGNLKLEWIYLGAVTIFRRRRRDTNLLLMERLTVQVSDNTGRIAQVDTKTRDDDGSDPGNPLNAPLIRYQYANHLGSAVLETNETGVPISYEEYHPYGTTAYRSSRLGADLSLKRYRFSGKELDDETGLYYFGARHYAPWLGRWTSSDPAGLVRGPNVFRYCSNSPVVFHDPNGKEDKKPLNPAGGVSWEIPKSTFQSSSGQKLPDAQTLANFESWMKSKHPERTYTPGSVTVEWTTRTIKGQQVQVPVFNAEWRGSDGKPLLPREGEFGFVAPMRKQAPAEYGIPGDKKTRLDENEHTTPNEQTKVVEPEYGNTQYKNDATVKAPRGVALDKTKVDNATTKTLQVKAANGQPINVTEEIDMPSNANFQRANDAAKAAGKPNVPNAGSINRGSLEQMGGRFERGKGNLPPAPSFGSRLGSFGTGFARAVIPGFVEAEMGAIAAPYVVGSLGITSPAVTGLAATMAAAPAVTASVVVASAAGGYLVGSAIGHAVEDASGSKALGVGAGTLSGAATGAAIGAGIGFLFGGIGAGPGAVIGGIIGGIAGFIGSFW